MDVGDFLRKLGLEQHEATFQNNGIDIRVLPKLTTEDLKDLGVTMVGHRRLLLEAIAALNGGIAQAPMAGVDAPEAAPMRLSPAASTGEAERRPLSVMFCDLIGSTALSSRLDPEDLRDVIRTYQACVTTTIHRFEGFIARYVGDGVLSYFGWPEARETDSERAVRAGLAVAAAINEARPLGEQLQVHVGIATGLVVVGEPIGSGDARQQTAIGETPNRAARLQGLAGPGQVVIDAATRRQIGGLFTCQDLGRVELKGLPAPTLAWQVLSENRTLGRFRALHETITPLVGREEEMELLLRRWTQAKAGNGRVVLISAEPGVGKSRLAEAFVERIAAEPHVWVRYFCSPHHQHSALYPVIAQMERTAGFAHADEPAARLAKLQALLAGTASLEDVALIAELHAPPSADLAPPLDVTPQRKKDKTFEALLRQVENLARQRPVLMTFDDLHWIDPSSLELLDRFIERTAGWSVLLLAMFRPEFQPPWSGQPHVTMLTLARLDRPTTAAMVAHVAGDAALPQEIVEEIAERTDGVPLFVEEMTKALLEAGTQSAALSAMSHRALSVPATLHASLMARLDRLGLAARDVAQTGAAIGREFGFSLLAFISDLPEPQLRDALDRLTNAGLLFVRGEPPESTYIFKHALVQDAAYSTLLRGRRQRLHSRVAATLEERFSEIVLMQPALLAWHCTEAGLADKAVAYWLQAGRQALVRSAMGEAIVHIRKGLEILASLPDSPPRQRQELNLQAVLAPALTATKGSSGAEVAETIARARTLAEQLDRPECLAPLIAGQWTFHMVRAEPGLALASGEQLEHIGVARNDMALQLLGRLYQGGARLLLGEFVAARAALERCFGLADRTYCHPFGYVDPYAMMLSLLAATLAHLGYIDQARSRMDEALSEARRLGHAYTLAHTLYLVTSCNRLMRLPIVHEEEFLTLSTEHGIRFCLGWGLAYRGRSLIDAGQAQKGIALLMQGLAELRPIGCVTNMPLLFTWLAEAHAMLGHSAEGQNYLAEAARIVETTDERNTEAELLHRMRGDRLNAAGDQSGAERHYREAIDIAERQSSKLIQLRASTSLARLWRNQGKREEARDLLGPIYNRFTEGFDAPDLKDAEALLNELA
jgi:class 3 adenylate cyclase/tetratricopeptide (TPR) repeat protein